jgi:hypothetical protein
LKHLERVASAIKGVEGVIEVERLIAHPQGI